MGYISYPSCSLYSDFLSVSFTEHLFILSPKPIERRQHVCCSLEGEGSHLETRPGIDSRRQAHFSTQCGVLAPLSVAPIFCWKAVRKEEASFGVFYLSKFAQKLLKPFTADLQESWLLLFQASHWN